MKNKNMIIIKVFLKVMKDIVTIEKSAIVFIGFLLAMASCYGYLLVNFIDYITMIATKISRDEFVDSNYIVLTICGYLFLICITNFVAQHYPVYRAKYNQRVREYVNIKLKDKLGNISYEYFESSIIFEKLERVDKKVIAGYEAVVESIFKVFEIILYMAVYITFLSKVNVLFAILVIVSILFSGIVATKMSKKKHKLFVDVTQMNQLRDYLDSIPKDKIMHQEYQSGRLQGAIFERYQEAYFAAQNGYLKTHAYTIYSEAKALLFFSLTMFASYFYLSSRIISGSEDIGVMISLIIIFDQLYGKAENLSYYISNRIEELLVVDEYFEILEYDEIQEDTKLISEDNSIQFNRVSYSYPQADGQAIEQLNLVIKSGEKVAIVGRNGSGKTTFCNILLGLLTQFEGSVKIGDEQYTKSNPIPCQMVKSISQDFNMYQIPITENVILRSKDEQTTEMWTDIMNKTNIGEIVNELPCGCDTYIGQLDENGIELSKGQEQKLAIARLLANDAPVWILDEPTAYLDPLAEIETYRLILELAGERTLLFVSHRLGFAPMADRIVVFDQGKVVEDGTHEELLELNGVYAHMYESQKSWYQ